jgi:transcriptional regulator with XRE-family HTH domain
MGKLREALATHVRRTRLEKGWTQEELAHRANLSVRYLGKVERSQVAASIDTIEALSKALDIAPSRILERPTRGLLNPIAPRRILRNAKRH